MSNAFDRMPDGRPISYEAMGYDSAGMREALPGLACISVLRAWRAGALKAMSMRDGRIHVVQTGHGPLAAMPDGHLAEIPFDTRLTADGRLVPYVEAEHGVLGRIEDPDA